MGKCEFQWSSEMSSVKNHYFLIGVHAFIIYWINLFHARKYLLL